MTDEKTPIGQKWLNQNSLLVHYENYFSLDVLQGEGILDILRGRSNVLIIDLMAESGTVSDLFNQLPKDTKKQGVVVSLEDTRTDEQKTNDALHGITQITGDITSSKTWKELAETLNGQKADIIFERALGGLSDIPNHADLLSILLQRAWGLLSENGIMLVQAPKDYPSYRSLIFPVKNWVAYAQEKGIDIRQGKYTGALYIRKTPGSPEHLPFPNRNVPNLLRLGLGWQVRTQPSQG